MTENLWFFEGDHSSNIPQNEYISLPAQPTWQEFCDAAKQAEFDVSDYDPNNDDDCMKIGNHITDLNEILGFEHIGKRATIIGLGYATYAEPPATPSQQPFLIDTDAASFHGVNICFYDGRWQAMLEVHCTEHTDDRPHGIYNIPPDANHLMAFTIDIADNDEPEDDDSTESIVSELHEDFKSARAFVQGEDFISADAASQRMLLDDICLSADQEIPHELQTGDVVIACAKYYTTYDDMHYSSHDNPVPGFDIHDFLTDLSDTVPEERYALNGKIIGVKYPELLNIASDQPLDTKMLDLNDGSYCLVLRSERERATHYIAPQTITDIY